jgi:KDO2-lipid IV(A) lauroyltransferase
LLFYIIRYRKDVVTDNLTKCFPDKKSYEIKKITKLFFKNNLADIFTEGIKGFTMSIKQLRKRYKIINPEILDTYFDKNQDVIAIASHYANWEWGIQALNSQIQHQAAALYKPMSNKQIDNYTKKLREKSDIHLVPINKTLDYFKSKKSKPVIYVMAADQYPGGSMDKAIWTDFLGRKTPCLHGPESYARYNNLPVFFFDVQRVKKGYYTLEIKLLADNPKSMEKGEITKLYMKSLEKRVISKPEDWLWSHKRWKNEKMT